MKKLFVAVSCLVLAIVLSAAGCAFPGAGSSEKTTLKIGLMPAVDAAPFLLAEKNGYFKEMGLDVTLEMFNNAQNRQSALQAQSIDGAMSDLIAAAVNVDGGFDLKATTMTNGMFPVLVKKGSEDKKDIKVGMMEVSVSNFLIDEWLGQKHNIEKVFINDIPTRLAAIGSGQLDMGLFPEPVASMGELQGLEKNIYDQGEYCPDVLVFTGKALKNKKEAIKLFHEAYDKAVAVINKDEASARDILMEKVPNLQPEIRDRMVLPKYTNAALPDDQYIQKVLDWTAEVLKKDLKVKPGDVVERKFIQK